MYGCKRASWKKSWRAMATTVVGVLVLVAVAVSPAHASSVTWEHHWIQDQGSHSNQLVSHAPQPYWGLCGGYMGSIQYANGASWIVHHAHEAPTFVVSPSGGNLSFTYYVSADTGSYYANPATLYLELERDYTTGEYYPNEAARPKYFTKNAITHGESATVSVSLGSSRNGHRVKLQFRCVQPNHPTAKFQGSTSGTSFQLYSIVLPT